MFEFLLRLLPKHRDEEYCEFFDDVGNVQDKYQLVVTDFYKFNRRLTEKICHPIIQQNKKFIYCAVGRMPGLWLASEIRKSEQTRLIDLPPKEESIFNHLKLRNFTYYSRQQHLVESSTRHLMRKHLESFLGKCSYGVTCYDDLIRFSIPYDERYIVFVNALPEMKSSLPSTILKIIDYVKEKDLLKELKEKSDTYMEKMNNHPDQKKKFIDDFFGGSNSINPIDKLLHLTFDPYLSCSSTSKNTPSSETSKNPRFDNDDFLHKIRYAALISMRSYPMGRYVRHGTSMVLARFDELEHLVESISRQKMRRKTIQFFGNVNFTYSVYEKIIRVSIPIDDDYVLFLTLDKNNEDPDEFLPDEISKLLNTINSLNSELFN